MNPDHVPPDLAFKGWYVEPPLLMSVHDVHLGDGVLLRPFVNLYGCTLGDNTRVGAYTEIGTGVKVGRDCKIGARVFIPQGITIGNEVFIGPGVTFCNDKYPRAKGDWKCLNTIVEDGASIGAGSVVMPGIVIGRGAMIGAGTLVLRDIAADEIYFNQRVE